MRLVRGLQTAWGAVADRPEISIFVAAEVKEGAL
jgi:hypothetical protein